MSPGAIMAIAIAIVLILIFICGCTIDVKPIKVHHHGTVIVRHVHDHSDLKPLAKTLQDTANE